MGKEMNRFALLSTVVTLVLISVNVMAEAATFHSSRVSFDSASTDAKAVVLPNTGESPTASAGPLNFIATTGSSIVLGTLGIVAPFTDGWSSLLDGNDLAIGGPENFLISVADGMSALAFEIHEPSADGESTDNCFYTCVQTEFLFEVIRGNSVVLSQVFSPVDDVLNFIGFTSTSSFDAIRVTDTTGNVDNEYFGNFLVSVTPVPTPAGLPLFLTFASLLYAMRRKPK